MTTGGVRTLVVGSCVSRDTFSHLPTDGFSLVGYVARQSLISAFSPPVVLLDAPALTSPFQQQMVSADFASGLPDVLRRTAGRVDLVLWDLTDERLGVWVLPDDTAVTRTVDLIAAGADLDVAAAGVLVELGTAAHRAMWTEAAHAFVRLVREHHPGAALVALAPPWAGVNESGDEGPSSFGLVAADANRRLALYYDTVADLGVDLIGRDLDVTTTPSHPWGEAPFHYSPHVYADLVARIRALRPHAPGDPDARA
ncbi:DUF6270 domain-containing protein [Serinibacter arcticus]|uniref:SGNH hydrolase-type esterase domain-containing protein n=1 Tax=Serinibacter arcticus TaxID=1655435 RepID=A0A4Z1E425_9MICO|nr:DUF6270 domain-containing protein [Serinibacter arcticus]TGO06696.1 hypothetical protein SERN_0888 [Serinibacter arcticus]